MINIIDKEKVPLKKWLLWNIENLNRYDFNLTSTNKSNFSIK